MPRLGTFTLLSSRPAAGANKHANKCCWPAGANAGRRQVSAPSCYLKFASDSESYSTAIPSRERPTTALNTHDARCVAARQGLSRHTGGAGHSLLPVLYCPCRRFAAAAGRRRRGLLLSREAAAARPRAAALSSWQQMQMLLLWALMALGVVVSAQPGCYEPIGAVHRTDTAGVRDPDDPAIWRHDADPAKSMILGTDKGSKTANHKDGSLLAYRPSGALILNLSLDHPNNVDVEYGLDLGGHSTDIAVTCERGKPSKKLRVFKLAPDSVTPIDGGGLDVFQGESEANRGTECMGVALYKRQTDGSIDVILSRKSGPSGSYLWQYSLHDSGDGRTVKATRVRQFGVFSGVGEIEAVAVDDDEVSAWRYPYAGNMM